MRRFRLCLIVCLLVGAGALASRQITQARSDGNAGDDSADSPRVGSCPVFPADNEWNRDISNDPVDPNSASYIAGINKGSGNKNLRAGFGLWSYYGLPYNVVSAQTPKVPVHFYQYGSQSDPGPYPIPLNAHIEQMSSDRHVIALDKDNCMLYELYKAFPTATGWLAASGASFDLRSNKLRPEGWTSADAAGLPIFPGLVRYEEVSTGRINHALRFLVHKGANSYIYPARHAGSTKNDPTLPPMGLRLRLKASFDTSKYTGQARIILDALKKYGMIVSDEAHESWYISGVSNPLWNRKELEALRKVPGTAFEVVTSRIAPLPTAILPTQAPAPVVKSAPKANAAQAVVKGPQATNLKVQYRTLYQSPGDATVNIRLRIINQTQQTIPLSELTVRYYFTNEGNSALSFACDYTALGCQNVTGSFSKLPGAADGADGYLTIGFNGGAGTLAPNQTTQEIVVRFNRQDWGNLDENNDYSFQATMHTLADWDRMPLYRRGALVWGSEPRRNQSAAVAAPIATPVPTFVPLTAPVTAQEVNAGVTGLQVLYKVGENKVKTNQIKPYLQLENTGTTPISLGQVKIRYYFASADNQSLEFACNYAKLGCDAITGRFVNVPNGKAGAKYYLEVGFTSAAGTLAPGGTTGDIRLRFNKANWSNFNQSKDYSFNPTQYTFGGWDKVTVYLNGKLMHGTEP